MSAGFGSHKLRENVRLGLLYELLRRSACVLNASLTYPDLSSLSLDHPAS